MKILFVAEMIGTLNALDSAINVLRERGCEFRFAATDMARTTLEKKGVELVPTNTSPAEVIRGFSPDLVLTGIADPIAGKLAPTIERDFALTAMDAGIPVVAYRDYGSLAPWTQALMAHPKSSRLLTFLFESSRTLRLVEGRSIREAKAVGSGYYDADAARNWAETRTTSRAAVGIAEDALVIFVNNAADHVRVLEMMNPVVVALGGTTADLVIIPSFHPKDPDAPFDLKSLTVKPSMPYDPVIAQLKTNPRIRVIGDVEFRRAVGDSKARIATADLVIMNPLSTETITTALAGIPQVICDLPRMAENCVTKGTVVEELRVVEEGCADVVYDATKLVSYLDGFPRGLANIRRRLLPRCEAFREEMKEPATPKIVEAVLEAATVS